MVEDIRKQIVRVPFSPFAIRMSDGQEYAVPTVDHIYITPRGFSVVVADHSGSVVLLPVPHMSGLHYQGNGAE